MNEQEDIVQCKVCYFQNCERTLYEGDEIKIHPFRPKGVLSASVDFDMEYEETFYVGVAHQVFCATELFSSSE